MTNKGTTILEMLVGSFIMLLVVSGILMLYVSTMTIWKEESARITLQHKATLAMEKMVRGVDGTSGIIGARNASVEDLTTLIYTSNDPVQERSFYLGDGGQLMYDPDTTATDDEIIIATNVTADGVSFTVVDGDMVTIDLELEDSVGNTSIKVNLSTKVKLRNKE